MSDYQDYEKYNYAFTQYGSPASYISEYGGMSRNPYWSAYRNTNKDKKDRMIGFIALKYEFTNWLNLQVRHGLDHQTTLFTDQLATGTPYWFTSGYTGDFRAISESFDEQNSDALLTAHGNVSDKINITATAGTNLRVLKTTYQLAQGQGLVIPDFYQVMNGYNRETNFDKSDKEVRSVFASASLSYDNWIYLDVTGRNDVSSTLPAENRSYPYASLGGSVILSELFSKKGIETGPMSFAKIRASWAKVGNDAEPFRLYDYYTIKVVNGVLTANRDEYKANPKLKPESVKSTEFGLDLRFFDNKVTVDFTWYKKNAFDQILKIAVPPATGYKYEYQNAGNVENKGIELAISGTPVTTKDFNWDLGLNFSKNTNTIIELTETTKVQLLSDASVSFLKVVAEEGGKYGDIWGYTYQRDEAGKILVDDNGIPLKSEDMSYLGNYQPDWMLGFNNNLSYKGFNLAFLIDSRIGGDVFMGSMRTGAANGNLAMTLDGRGETGIVVPNSIVASTGEVNTKAVSSQDYWGGISSITEEWMYKATNVCFRELSLGYSIPADVLKHTFIKGAKVSLVGRNLFMIYSTTKGFNPEATYSTGNAQGIEYGTMPQMRSLGFNVNLSL
jgi:outer membrane receptor protein involved in Fe transport